MPKVTFIENSGAEHVVEADAGTKVRDAAVENDVPGIDGDCGGNCACGTCHVYVTEPWIDKTGRVEAESQESEMLEFAFEPNGNSRLCCQIILSDDLDGLVVQIPVGQH